MALTGIYHPRPNLLLRTRAGVIPCGCIRQEDRVLETFSPAQFDAGPDVEGAGGDGDHGGAADVRATDKA